MKTNIKLRVTPEQSKAVQKICFANGINWKQTDFNKSTINVKYIFINLTNLTKCAYLASNYFEAHSYTEVDADLFIQTNGTCEEDMFKQYGFEIPDFDCTILAKVKDEYVGYVINNNAIIAVSWTLRGTCYTGKTYNTEYNLTPIKEPWYETCKFPVLVWDEDNDLFALRTRGEYTASYLSICKPLSNDEIDQLKQDF